MLIKRTAEFRPSEITPEAVFRSRREVLRAAGFLGATALLAGTARAEDIPARHRRLSGVRKSALSVREASNSFEDLTSYNNFYEFGLDKGDPAANSGRFKPQPWTVTVDGEAEDKGPFNFEDIVKPHPGAG